MYLHEGRLESVLHSPGIPSSFVIQNLSWYFDSSKLLRGCCKQLTGIPILHAERTVGYRKSLLECRAKSLRAMWSIA